MNNAPLGKVTRPHAPLIATFEQSKRSTEDLIQIHGDRLGFHAHALQQGPNRFEFLSIEVARLVLSRDATLSKLMLLGKIGDRF